MRAIDIIIKKRDCEELSEAEINYFVHEYAIGNIPDYQASAWAMAVLLNGMTDQETKYLTLAMANSGEILDLTGIVPIAVDKHSTGGVGDKTTLVVEPIVAACGLPVGKMSGRGLGFSGGTLDKIESIPGYRTNLTTKEFLSQLSSLGLVLTGQTGDLAPADGKLYALRDVTGTVQSIPLIASSVMSKKIAAGAQAIILDVKVGVGAFMENIADAQELSKLMVSIAKLANRKAVAIISDMNQPLGQAVGNALELKEAIMTLDNGGPRDFVEHCYIVASHMLIQGGLAANELAARALIGEVLQNGKAWKMFVNLVDAQGGDISYVENPERLPTAPVIETVYSPRDGYLSEINARIVGETAVFLGAGRSQKGDPIDYAVGIEILRNVGDEVNRGDELFVIHSMDRSHFREAKHRLLNAHKWSDKRLEPLPLSYGVIE